MHVAIEGAAGGDWTLRREAEAGVLCRCGAAPTAKVTLSDDSAWRLFSKGLAPEQARARPPRRRSGPGFRGVPLARHHGRTRVVARAATSAATPAPCRPPLAQVPTRSPATPGAALPQAASRTTRSRPPTRRARRELRRPAPRRAGGRPPPACRRQPSSPIQAIPTATPVIRPLKAACHSPASRAAWRAAASARALRHGRPAIRTSRMPPPGPTARRSSAGGTATGRSSPRRPGARRARAVARPPGSAAGAAGVAIPDLRGPRSWP